MASSPPSPSPKKLKMSSTSSEPEPESQFTTTERKPRYKRRKVAIFIAYCGFGYRGMQKNPGARTIESDLEEALYHSGAVPESDKSCPKRYDWARSARTDKGVSAVGQVVSDRFYIDPPGFVERLNSNLSDQIRVFGFKRVTNSFNAQKFCDRRRYVYLLPMFALDPNSHLDRESVMVSVGLGNELAKCVECLERGRKVVGIMGKQSRFSKEEEMSKLNVKNGDIVENFDIGNVELKDRGSRVLKEEEIGKPDVGNGCVNEKVEIGTGELKHEDPRVLIEEEMKYSSTCNLNSEGTTEIEIRVTLEEGKSEIADSRVWTEEISENVTDGEKIVMEAGTKFEYGDKTKERFNSILKCYEGTHNFHNFTTRTKAEDFT